MKAPSRVAKQFSFSTSLECSAVDTSEIELTFKFKIYTAKRFGEQIMKFITAEKLLLIYVIESAFRDTPYK